MKGTGLRRRVAILVTLAMLGSLVWVVPSASAAAGTFTGGAYDMPLYMANDHTPVGIRLNVTGGLEANTSYYLKIRFTVAVTPDSATNRGWTWNPTTNTWIQEREAWTSFPVVTTDASGLLDTWAFTKFGDDDESGDYYSMIALSKTVASSSTTRRCSGRPREDMTTRGAWVPTHGDGCIRRQACRGHLHASTSTVFALARPRPTGGNNSTTSSTTRTSVLRCDGRLPLRGSDRYGFRCT